ncbi:class B sortase [Virgibacillus halophilus]|uniref:Class B sortase n=2 Tax=Tigheibacillus halophilus TaxID=361280 RepID=A0ABU5C4A8_9BACI|nr:class B sortase [Virgibacillus halophilus]
MRKYKKKNSIIQRLLTIISIAVFLYASYHVGSTLWQYYHNRQILAEAQEVYDKAKQMNKKQHPSPAEASIAQTKTAKQEKRASFDPLQQLNTDIVGWIEMEGTMINYPILQADDNTFYLYRNYKKQDSIAGSIFLDYRNDISETNRNWIVYGHRMKDGSMFGQLKKWLNDDFFKRNHEIYLDTLYDSYDAEIFSVYQTSTDFYYIETDFDNEASFQNYIDEIEKKSLFHSDTEVTAEDSIITLSTCDYGVDPDKGRLVVHAKLKKR